MIQIRYPPNYVIGQKPSTVLNMFRNYGVEAASTNWVTTSSGKSLNRAIVNNPFIAAWRACRVQQSRLGTGWELFQELECEAIVSGPQGTISAVCAQAAQGNDLGCPAAA